jgi:amino acid adenylation domain-containing protein
MIAMDRAKLQTRTSDLLEQQWLRNDTSDNSEDTIPSRFERQVATLPDKLAIATDQISLTYRALDLKASRIAAVLASLPSQHDRPIALLMKDEVARIAAMLGALKASRIFIPLAPDSPEKWLTQVVEDSGTAQIIVDGSTRSIARLAAAGNVAVMEVEQLTRSLEPFVAGRTAAPDDTAYIVYTSGSTGRPKGVANSHSRLIRTADVRYAVFGLGRSDRYANFASSGVARGMTNTFLPLLSGGCLFPFNLHRHGLQKLAPWLIAQKITYVWFSCSLLRTWLGSLTDDLRFPELRFVGATGEPLYAKDVLRLTRHLEGDWRIGHSYSSTEAGVIAAQVFTPSRLPDSGIVAVGRPVDGVDVSIKNEAGAFVPPGEVGEIVVRSQFLAQGYWNNPELTDTVFQVDPHDSAIRIYRTGDLGRFRSDGALEHLGRKGRGIRLRGYSVEPFQVECELMRRPGVTDAIVLLHDGAAGLEPCLVGYVVATPNTSPSAIRNGLAERLPSYMVPSYIIVLDSFPIASSGKIDRKALPPPSREEARLAAFRAPSDDRERELLAIWQKVLKIPNIGIDDNFFELGGDSLQALTMFLEIEARLGCSLAPTAIVQAPTIARLAEIIRATTGAAASQSLNECREVAKTSPIVRVPRTSTVPMSLFQEAIWNHCRHREDRAGLTQVHCYRVVGPLDIQILKDCLSYLIARHEILRTTFGLVDGCPAQIIHESVHPDLLFFDLIDADDPEGQADSIIREESSQDIDLEKLPIRRNVLIRITNNNYQLVRISHPLITDGFASQILDAELATSYEAILHGEEPPFPKVPPLQYADYAVWQRQVMRRDGPYFNAVLNSWKSLNSTTAPATRLPFRRLIRRAPRDPSEGVLQWNLEERVAKQLDEIARGAGATHFTVRLAVFAALIAHVTASSTIVIGTGFANRNHVETQNIVGPFLNAVHLIFSYDENKTFLEWLAFIRNQVFEATTRSEVPYDMLRASGVESPEIEIYFTMVRDQSDQHFGNLEISNEICSVGTMPRKCFFEINERKPENCRVSFDANIYDRNEMRVMLDGYLRVLEAAAREPQLPIGKLLMMAGSRPLRWTCANYLGPFYEFVTAFYASSPLLKMFWRPIKRWVLSSR